MSPTFCIAFKEKFGKRLNRYKLSLRQNNTYVCNTFEAFIKLLDHQKVIVVRGVRYLEVIILVNVIRGFFN